MSAKPGTTPIWNTSAAGMTAPTGGQETNGVADGDFLTAGLFDYLIHWLCAWTAYLADGIIQHANKTREISASAGHADDAAWVFVANGSVLGTWEVGALNKSVIIPVSLDVGERIKEVRGSIRDTSGGATIIMSVWKQPDTSAATQLGTDQTSGATGATQTLTVTGLTETVASKTYYFVRFKNGAAGALTDQQVRGVEITYDRVTS